MKLNYKPHNIYFFVAIFIARCYKYPPSQDMSLGIKPIVQFGFRRRLFLSKQVNGALFRSLSAPEVNFFPLLKSKSFVTVDIYAVCLPRDLQASVNLLPDIQSAPFHTEMVQSCGGNTNPCQHHCCSFSAIITCGNMYILKAFHTACHCFVAVFFIRL